MSRLAKFAVAMLIGIASGIGCYTFIYARGYSYLTNDPAACDNCHIMNEQFDGWLKSSHRHVAVCNDCHTPPSWLGKYFTKGVNGFWHSFYFTSGLYPDTIMVTPRNHAVAESSCIKCHRELVDQIRGEEPQAALSCVHCHGAVGHP